MASSRNGTDVAVSGSMSTQTKQNGAQGADGANLVLPFLSIVVGFLLTAAILNSATGGNMGAFAVLAVVVVTALVSFFHLLKVARALDEIDYAAHASDRVKREGKRLTVTPEHHNR